jgi:hypothetical protein
MVKLNHGQVTRLISLTYILMRISIPSGQRSCQEYLTTWDTDQRSYTSMGVLGIGISKERALGGQRNTS